jgi:hypothetical protein
MKANSVEEAGEKGYNMLTDPLGLYVKKFGPRFEVKGNTFGVFTKSFFFSIVRQ